MEKLVANLMHLSIFSDNNIPYITYTLLNVRYNLISERISIYYINGVFAEVPPKVVYPLTPIGKN